MTGQQFQVRKDRLADTRCVRLPDMPLAQGDVRVRIDRFAYTANNITYAAFGEAMGYWQFFPVAPDADGTPWGCIPVWGFGEVVESRCDGVAPGERFYGYWPMASHAVVQPVRVDGRGFVDGAPHRAGLHAVYNQYLRCATDPLYTADSEDLQALLRPLFLTAWLIDDFLADNAYFGATQAGPQTLLLLSSASSKTAYSTAAMLAQRAAAEPGPGLQVVGLTSAARLPFCQSLGVYHRVLGYEQLGQLPPGSPSIYVDFAGNGGLRLAVHQHFSTLAYSCSIGGTHVDQLAGGRQLPGPRPVLFFAPAQAKKRAADWGAAAFGNRLVEAWHGFSHRVTQGPEPWLLVQRHSGAAAVQAAHLDLLAGRVDARHGMVLSLP